MPPPPLLPPPQRDATVQHMLNSVGLGIADAICVEEFEIMWKDNKADGFDWSVGNVLSNVPLVGGLFSKFDGDVGIEESKTEVTSIQRGT